MIARTSVRSGATWASPIERERNNDILVMIPLWGSSTPTAEPVDATEYFSGFTQCGTSIPVVMMIWPFGKDITT
jgi:hypothetical protein